MPGHAFLAARRMKQDADIRIARISPKRHIRGRFDVDLGSDPMTGHKVGQGTGAETPSGGFRRRDRMCGCLTKPP